MKKSKILYIESNTDGTIGGSYYSLFYLIQGIDREKFDPVVMFYQENVLLDKFKNVCSEVIIFDHDSPTDGMCSSVLDRVKWGPRFFRDILWSQFAIGRMISKIRPDLVHLNNSYAVNHDWVLACRRKGIKIIAHDRGARPPASLQTRFFVQFMDAVISVSDAYLKNINEQGLKPKKACRVYNGLDAKTFKDLAPSINRDLVRADLGVGEHEILIGMVGNIDHWKGQLVLLEAIYRVKQQYDHVKAVFVGKTVRGGEEYERKLRTYIDDHGLQETVVLAGYREDVPALLAAFDIFAHASVEPEPFGRVIIEAMAMQKPIVATNSGGPVEIIEHNRSGLLVPMGESKAMAEAILFYLDNPSEAKRIATAAQERFYENFTSEKMVQGVEKVYREVLGL